LNHFLLIARPDSLARSILPNVLGADDRLSVTANSQEMLALLRQEPLDAVLVEFEAQDEDAAVLCRTVRRSSDAPIVMLVNHAAREQVTRGYRLGADTHVELPCDPRIFHARVRAVLRRKAG
jgi:DNA-binding response OmpR family regulator